MDHPVELRGGYGQRSSCVPSLNIDRNIKMVHINENYVIRTYSGNKCVTNLIGTILAGVDCIQLKV